MGANFVFVGFITHHHNFYMRVGAIVTDVYFSDAGEGSVGPAAFGIIVDHHDLSAYFEFKVLEGGEIFLAKLSIDPGAVAMEFGG